jgi:hypothetical protein
MLCHFKLLSLKTPKSVKSNVVNVLSIVMKVVSIDDFPKTFIDSLGLLP